MELPFEPFRIRVVEPIRPTTLAEREAAIRAADGRRSAACASSTGRRCCPSSSRPLSRRDPLPTDQGLEARI